MKVAKDMVQGLLFFLHEQSEIPGLVKAFLAMNPSLQAPNAADGDSLGDVGGSFV